MLRKVAGFLAVTGFGYALFLLVFAWMPEVFLTDSEKIFSAFAFASTALASGLLAAYALYRPAGPKGS